MSSRDLLAWVKLVIDLGRREGMSGRRILESPITAAVVNCLGGEPRKCDWEYWECDVSAVHCAWARSGDPNIED